MGIAMASKVTCAETAVANFETIPNWATVHRSKPFASLCRSTVWDYGYATLRERALERVTGINHNSVLNWVRQAAAAIPQENYEIPETAQLDELETFVGQKKQNLAMDGGEYKTSRHPQVRGGRSLSGDL